MREKNQQERSVGIGPCGDLKKLGGSPEQEDTAIFSNTTWNQGKSAADKLRHKYEKKF